MICPYCQKPFQSLGIMRHRTAHRERRAEIKQLQERLDSGRYDTADLKRYDKLRKLEGIK